MRLSVAILAALCLLAALPAGAHARSCPGGTLKPELVSELPSELAVHEAAPGQWYLIFRAGMRNEGTGPLKIVGERRRVGAPMRSQQVLECAGRSPVVRRNMGIGAMSFVRQPTHKHFHLRDIERYRLLGLANGVYHRSYKRGFCMGDSYDPGIAIASKPAVGDFDGDLLSACGQGRPNVLRIVEGLSVGWGDYYSPLIEGQYVDLTELPAGDYRVVTELDPFKRLVVGSRRRAVGGVDFRMSWPDGRGNEPRIDIRGSCNVQVTCASRVASTNLLEGGSASLGRAQPNLGGRLSG